MAESLIGLESECQCRFVVGGFQHSWLFLGVFFHALVEITLCLRKRRAKPRVISMHPSLECWCCNLVESQEGNGRQEFGKCEGGWGTPIVGYEQMRSWFGSFSGTSCIRGVHYLIQELSTAF